jgi:hypothetical protein
MPTDRPRRLGVCTVVLVAGLLAGCGGSGSGSSSTTTSSAASAKGVVLGTDGLGIVQTGGAQTPAVQAVSRYLGPPTKTTTPGPCNGTTEVEWSDLSLEFSHGVLDGYRYMEGGLSDAGAFHPPTGPATPVLKTTNGATLGMTLAEVRPLYPASAFSEVQGGAIVVFGTKSGERLFLGFFSTTPTTPLTEIKGGNTCGDV